MLIRADAFCKRDPRGRRRLATSADIILPPFEKPFEFQNLGDTEDMYLSLGGMGIGLTSWLCMEALSCQATQRCNAVMRRNG